MPWPESLNKLSNSRWYRHRGIYLSYINVVIGIGAGLGATFGGVIAEAIGWRWEFGVQVPPLLICLGIVGVVIPDNLGVVGEREPVEKVIREFDAPGAFLLTLAVSTLILGLDLGGNILPCKFKTTCLCPVLLE